MAGILHATDGERVRELLRARHEDVDYVERHLSGRGSRDLFLDALDYYGGGRLKYALKHAADPPGERYLLHAGRFMSGEVRVVDCGAYMGDTVAAVLGRMGKATSRIEFDAFEPDPANFAKLEARAAKLSSDRVSVRCRRACAYDQSSPVGFRYGSGRKSRIDPGSGETAPCVRLENEIRTGLPVSLLKIGACGSELGALSGARGMVMSDRPYLAVAVPGSFEGALDLCTYAMASQLGYRWTLRGYARTRPDLVLYGEPGIW